MVPTVHQHVRINGRPAVILTVDATQDLWAVLAFWPAQPRPPHASGRPRPGSWSEKFAVFAYHATDATWYWDTDQPISVQENADPLTQIDPPAWFAAFAQACHAAAR